MKIIARNRTRFFAALTGVATVAGFIWWLSPETPPSRPLQVAALANIAMPTAPPDAAETLRVELREALQEGVPAQKRVDLLAAVSGPLTAEECEALLHALLQPRQASTPEGWHSEYMHNLARILQSADSVRERFARVLATLARDSRRDESVRDYALQHLRQVWDGADADLRKQIESSFKEFVQDPFLSSSALLSLHLLGSGATPEAREALAVSAGKAGEVSYHVGDAEISPLVSRILAEAPSANLMPGRLTALRIVGDRRLASFRGDLRRIAAADGEHALVRMAAVANLGRISDPADRAFLESLDTRDGRLANAVRRALASIR